MKLVSPAKLCELKCKCWCLFVCSLSKSTHCISCSKSSNSTFMLLLNYDLLEDRRIEDVLNILFGFVKQLDSMLPYDCSVKDHRRPKKCDKEMVTYSDITGVPRFCCYYTLTSSVIYYWLWNGQRWRVAYWFRMRVSGLVLSFKYGWLAQMSILSFEPWHYLDSDLSRVINYVNTCKWRADIVYTL